MNRLSQLLEDFTPLDLSILTEENLRNKDLICFLWFFPTVVASAITCDENAVCAAFLKKCFAGHEYVQKKKVKKANISDIEMRYQPRICIPPRYQSLFVVRSSVDRKKMLSFGAHAKHLVDVDDLCPLTDKWVQGILALSIYHLAPEILLVSANDDFVSLSNAALAKLEHEWKGYTRKPGKKDQAVKDGTSSKEKKKRSGQDKEVADLPKGNNKESSADQKETDDGGGKGEGEREEDKKEEVPESQSTGAESDKPSSNQNGDGVVNKLKEPREDPKGNYDDDIRALEKIMLEVIEEKDNVQDEEVKVGGQVDGVQVQIGEGSTSTSQHTEATGSTTVPSLENSSNLTSQPSGSAGNREPLKAGIMTSKEAEMIAKLRIIPDHEKVPSFLHYISKKEFEDILSKRMVDREEEVEGNFETLFPVLPPPPGGTKLACGHNCTKCATTSPDHMKNVDLMIRDVISKSRDTVWLWVNDYKHLARIMLDQFGYPAVLNAYQEPNTRQFDMIALHSWSGAALSYISSTQALTSAEIKRILVIPKEVSLEDRIKSAIEPLNLDADLSANIRQIRDQVQLLITKKVSVETGLQNFSNISTRSDLPEEVKNLLDSVLTPTDDAAQGLPEVTKSPATGLVAPDGTLYSADSVLIDTATGKGYIYKTVGDPPFEEFVKVYL
ncbi:hypothetical protein [Serbia mononega-like virus 1]|uniref:Uncharacterized protein n=1 Tax=Serbia mononega-like virus 1 TaxID=2771455 RepID=A0A7H1C8Z3_9MONO|nr:hypothetical protein [Serbia mononega-like virus 1]